MTHPHEHIDELIERSSLGCPEAKALRASIPDAVRHELRERLIESLIADAPATERHALRERILEDMEPKMGSELNEKS